MKSTLTTFLATWSITCSVTIPAVYAETKDDRSEFERQMSSPWQEVFVDPCTADWQQQWFLDGDQAVVENLAEGMKIDATQGYAVLWTQQSFAGDLRIEYEFKRVDTRNRGVNIVYIQATGDGQKGHTEDISKWSDRRRSAAMSDYFLNMHTYHVSYAAYPNFGFFLKDYVRGRRYMPLANQGLDGTELTGELKETGLFEDQQWINLTILKTDKELLLQFEHPEREPTLLRMRNEDKPPITQGRVGLRLMPGRISQIKNFRVFQKESPSPAGEANR